MKQLTLVRHAKSDWSDSSLRDFDRPLNKRGKRNAPDMGRRLAARRLRPSLLISSPANRALTTAMVIADALGYPEDEIIREEQLYAASARAILAVIREVDSEVEHLMIFGHNPGMTDFANRLADADIDNMPTCAVLSLSIGVGSWAEVDWHRAQAVFYDYPKRHKK